LLLLLVVVRPNLATDRRPLVLNKWGTLLLWWTLKLFLLWWLLERRLLHLLWRAIHLFLQRWRLLERRLLLSIRLRWRGEFYNWFLFLDRLYFHRSFHRIFLPGS
jgi:hypothetical protein